MKRIIAAASAATLGAAILLTPSANAAAPASEPTIVNVKKSDYSKKKRNRFWRTVKSYDPIAALAGKKSVIDLGVSTCDFLRAGGDLFDLSLMVYELDAGIAEDHMIAVMAAAPVVLCPDQAYKFE